MPKALHKQSLKPGREILPAEKFAEEITKVRLTQVHLYLFLAQGGQVLAIKENSITVLALMVREHKQD